MWRSWDRGMCLQIFPRSTRFCVTIIANHVLLSLSLFLMKTGILYTPLIFWLWSHMDQGYFLSSIAHILLKKPHVMYALCHHESAYFIAVDNSENVISKWPLVWMCCAFQKYGQLWEKKMQNNSDVFCFICGLLHFTKRVKQTHRFLWRKLSLLTLTWSWVIMTNSSRLLLCEVCVETRRQRLFWILEQKVPRFVLWEN